MIVRSGRHCSRTESVTALICSGRNWTEPNTGYSHLLACSSVTYRGRNEHTYIHRSTTLHITLARHWTNRDVSRLQCSYIIREISSENASHGLVPEQQMFRDRTEAMLFRPEQYQYPFRYHLYTTVMPVLCYCSYKWKTEVIQVHNVREEIYRSFWSGSSLSAPANTWFSWIPATRLNSCTKFIQNTDAVLVIQNYP